jgi:hypothetical protein
VGCLDKEHHVSTLPPPTDPHQAPLTTRISRGVWVGFGLIAGIFAGAAAGVFAYAGGVAAPLAVLAGGEAMGTCTGLFLALVTFATTDR